MTIMNNVSWKKRENLPAYYLSSPYLYLGIERISSDKFFIIDDKETKNNTIKSNEN